MKLIIFVFSISLWWTACIASEEIKREDGVIVLTAKNWNEVFAKHSVVLVEFYAPWCGHCKSLAPEYAKAAKMLEEQKLDIVLGKVDATQETALAQKYEVKGYPTLKFFNKGKEISFNGGRTASDIVQWLKKKTGPPATTLTSAEHAKELAEAAEVIVMGFFKDVDSKKAKAFLQAASENDEVPFTITADKALFKEYDVDKDNAIVLIKKFDNLRDVFDGKFEEEAINKFVSANSLPLVMEFNRDSAQKIFGGSVKNHLLMFMSKSADVSAEKIEILRKVAKDFKGEVLFVTIDTDEAENKRVMDFFNLEEAVLPSLRMIQPEQEMTKYKPETAEITEDSVRTFIKKVLNKTLKPHLLSQDLPDDWDKEPVKVLVSSNFDKVTLDKEKDVLVEFYAPWCGHCKQLAPIYDELAEKFKDNPSVLIAKMDSTVNELEHTKVKSYPTLKLYKKETNEVVDYSGERNLKELSAFLERGGAPAEEEPKDKDEDEDEDDKKKKDEL